MIIPPHFLLILAILPTITAQADPKFSSKNSILDWSTCGKETMCFCRDYQTQLIAEVKTGFEREPQPRPSTVTDADVGKCNIGVQNRFFTFQTAVIQFQLIEEQASDNNGRLMLHHDGNDLFGCEYTNGKKPKVVGDDAKIRSYRIVPFEDRSHCRKGSCVCALMIGRADKMKSDVDEAEFKRAKTTIRRLATAQPADFAFAYPGNYIYVNWGETCDPYSFKDDTNSPEYDDFLISPLMSKDLNVLSCKDHDTPEIKYSMKFEQSDSSISELPEKGEMKELKCAKDPKDSNNKRYIFSLVTDELDEAGAPKEYPIEKSEKFTFFCAAPINVLCKNPNEGCDSSTNTKCPIFGEGATGKAATLECKDKKWLIDDEYYVLTEEAVCKKDPITGTKDVKFYITPPSSPEKEVSSVEKAQCFTEYDCKKTAKVHFIGCDQDMSNCGAIDYKDGIVKCKNETIDLKISNSGMNQTARALKCDTADGLWKNATGDGGGAIAANSRVQCFEQKTYAKNAEAKMSTSNMAAIIGGALGGALFLAALVVTGILLFQRRRRIFGQKTRNVWLKLDKTARIGHCKQTIEDIMKGTAITEIKFGLRLLELMLDTETEDPEIWDEMYPFLTRFMLAVGKLDSNIYLMFTRFLYLRAKKIIDKHGWISKKPITKINPSGLIRTVAIRLLTFCLIEGSNPEAAKLLKEGFLKLGFKGRQQYPHCGLMWTAILHTRLDTVKRKDKDGKAAFDSKKFTRKLIRLAMKMNTATDDVIAPFGSCSQQAAFALGAWWKLVFHIDSDREYALNKDVQGGAVSMSYFLGMCDSPSINPWPFIMETYGFRDPNKERLDEMYLVAPEAEWNAKILRLCRIVTYLGRNMDAQFLLPRIMPSMTASKQNDLLTELYTEQDRFYKAMEKQAEDLREFFAQYTDKNELKEKPTYVTADMGKLDSRVNTGKVTDVLAGPNANSCGGSDKSSGSDTKTDTKSGVNAGPSSNPEPPKSNDGKQEPSAPSPAPATAPPTSEPAAPGEPPAAKGGPPTSEPAAP